MTKYNISIVKCPSEYMYSSDYYIKMVDTETNQINFINSDMIIVSHPRKIKSRHSKEEMLRLANELYN